MIPLEDSDLLSQLIKRTDFFFKGILPSLSFTVLLVYVVVSDYIHHRELVHEYNTL